MDEQIQTQPAARPLSGMVRIIIINIVVSALISMVAFWLIFPLLSAPLANRVSVLETEMAKQMKAYHVK